MALNLDYLKTKRGIIKIVQIILGLICIYLLCGPGANCFQRGECLTFSSAVNAAFLFLNIVLFSNVYKIILTVVDVSAIAKIEKYYAILGLILFAIAFGLMLWYNVEHRGPGEWVAAMVILGIIGGLFAFDFMILSGKASD